MRSILSLPPVLQEVWSRVYAATIASGRAELDAGACERSAWEAVRRANGGEMPEAHEEHRRWTILNEAVKQPCPVTGEPFFMVLKHPELGWVPTYGGPHDSWTAPETDGEDEEAGRAPMLYRYRYDHDEGKWREYEAMGMCAVVAVRPQEEPTDEEMVEALAPIAAKLCHALHASPDVQQRIVEACGASWKAARAWGKK